MAIAARRNGTGHPTPANPGPSAFHELPRSHVIATMAGLMVTLLLAALDQTIVGTAMPRIVADLHGFENYAWPTTAYLLASTAVVPLVGKLSDIYGRRIFLIGGTAFFVAASALCGLAQDMVQLSAFRGLQGAGAGILLSSVFTVGSALFPPAQRARIQGVFSATFGVASVAGPLLGGYLTDTLGWRSVFSVNVPVGIIALIVLWFSFRDVRVEHRIRSVDYLGAIVLVAAVVPFLLALSWGGHEYAWESAQVIGLLAFAAVMTGAFIAIELRVDEPILPLDLFTNRTVAMCGVLVGLSMSGMFGAGLFVPLFVQAVIGTTATESGTVLAPMMVAMVAASIGCGQLIGRTGRYKWVAVFGISASAVGMFLLSGMGADTDYATVARNIVVVGFGMGATMPCFNLAAQNAVSLSQLGVVTALTQFLRSIGATVGAAILGSMLVNRFGPELQHALPTNVAAALPPGRMEQISNPQALLNPDAAAMIRESFTQAGPQAAPLFEPVMTAIKVALAGSLHEVFITCGIILTLAGLITLFLPDLPLQRTFADEAESEAPAREPARSR
jgi:EmrB/QacA subfamily drug resistance transporter